MMKTANTNYIRSIIVLVVVFSLCALSLLIFVSWYNMVRDLYQQQQQLALQQAKDYWKKDQSFRRWATLHGGVYVEPDKNTPPNPALSHIPDRDVVTTDGKKLTLMNPAYMLRQITEQFEKDYGVKGKITGKKQLNPINKPDPWQARVLDLFEQGKTQEYWDVETINGKPYLRYMRAMYMTEGCVKCHGILGYRDGDLRGGVSVSVPLAPYYQAADEIKQRITGKHIIVWLSGVSIILVLAFWIYSLFRRMSFQVLHDDLTGLPNLILFKDRVQHAHKKFLRQQDYFFAVCFLDLDRFKNINDSMGHGMGDKLLGKVAQRLLQTLRPGDTVARIGGDEFALLLDEVKGVDDALMIAERILDCFNSPFLLENEEIYTNASIGLCMVSKQYEQIENMIRDADIAMYRAKEAGRGRIDVFNPEMHQYAQETLKIENELRKALAKKQLEIYYQPIIALKENRIEGFEALLRWQHPEMGMIPPDRFIPVAEKTGQINEIGRWVLGQAMRQINHWNLQFSADKPLSVAVNLSGGQVATKGLCKYVAQCAQEQGFDLRCLHLEVTETMIVTLKDRAREAIENFRKLGVAFSIDDFGTGYSSLTYLQEFEFDILKIDKSFVQGMSNDEKSLKLVKTILLLARDLKLQVVAEGVETREQLERLRAMNPNIYIQGYYYSRPLPAEQVKQLLKEGVYPPPSTQKNVKEEWSSLRYNKPEYY